jgi:hypothetical protein
MQRVFKTRPFARWARKAGLSNEALCRAAAEMTEGLIDADLGGGVVKKRVALPGRGKSGGSRTLVATNKADRWFFIYGFQKNERANTDDKELQALQEAAADLLTLTAEQLNGAVRQEILQEICDESKNPTEKPDS